MADKERYINERLIAEVSRYEVLYNTKCPNYKIGSERDPAWAQVAASMASTRKLFPYDHRLQTGTRFIYKYGLGHLGPAKALRICGIEMAVFLT